MAWGQSLVMRQVLGDAWAGSPTPDKSDLDGEFRTCWDANGLWRLEPEGDPLVPGTAAWEARWARYDALADAEAAGRSRGLPVRTRVTDCLGDWLGAALELLTGEFGIIFAIAAAPLVAWGLLVALMALTT